MIEGDRGIVLTRTVGAPRDLVWRAWTEPERIARWWGPNGYSITVHEMDVRVGGVWRFTMLGPDGRVWANHVAYTEVVAPERLAYDHGDEERVHFTSVATFDDLEDGRTGVTLRMRFPTPEARKAVMEFGAIELGNQTLSKLDDYLTQS